VQVETVTNNLRFPGQYADAETGLLYNFHRYYDPKIGRYVRTDPIGFDAGHVNLYEYVSSNPLNKRDPQGLRVDEPGKAEEQEEECCQVEWPKSPIKEIALMCYAESSPPYKCSDQNEREREKRAMTDTVYNRMKKNRPHWGGSDAIDVLKKKGQYLAYGNAKYLDAETPDNLSDEACQELNACIKAAKASAISQKYPYTQFDQSSKSFKGHKHTKICVHYFRTLER
jgi:RHS repeat-associated protein